MNTLNSESLVNSGIEFQNKGDLDSAESLYRKVLAADPNNVDALHLLGVLKNSQGKHREGLNLVNTAISINRAAIFLNSRGMIFIDMALYEDAANDLRAALKLSPEYAEALNNMGVVYLKTGKREKALDVAKKAVVLNEGLVQAWLTLGSAHFELRDYEEATKAYTHALSLDKNAAIAHINLAKISYMQGDMEAALKQFESLRVAGFNSLDLAYPHANILLSKGEIQKSADLILDAYNTATDWSPLEGLVTQDAFFSVLWKVCGYFTDVLGKPTEAAFIYQKSVDHVPSYGHLIWVNIAKIYFDINRIDEAIGFCQKAIESKVTTPLILHMADRKSVV